MRDTDFIIEKASANNFHPDQVWARRLRRELALRAHSTQFVDSKKPMEEEKLLVCVDSLSEIQTRINNNCILLDTNRSSN